MCSLCCESKWKFLKITFLGTGTSQGVPVIGCACQACVSTNKKDNRLRTSIHIEIDDLSVVVDTGPDFRYQMLRAGISELDAILITHEHNDHIIGLDDIRAFNYSLRKDIPLYTSERVLKDLKSRFQYVFHDNSYPGVPRITAHPIEASQAFAIKGIDILPIEVLHGYLPVLGFRIGSFTYITDAKTIDEEAQELIKGTEVLVLNALRFREHHSHFTVDQAIEMAHKLEAKTTYLTHISHNMGLVDKWETNLPEGIHAAFDGLVVEL